MTTQATAFRHLGPGPEVSEGGANPYYLEDRKHRVTVARVGGKLYAFDDLCTCADRPCPLSAGLLTDTTIMCQCHGSQFDITTGDVIRGPADKPLRTYEVREQDGTVLARV
jgi:3-phenylpropionate/trans-cinnamate dioxygenase ferredoxin subunit